MLWISYEIHLIPYERPGERGISLESVVLTDSGGFHVKSTRFHDERLLTRGDNAYVLKTCARL